MDFWYLVAAYIHITTVAVWLGAMLFEDPASDRFMCRILYRIRGAGWLSLLILIATGVFMLASRGVGLSDVFSGRFFADRYGQVFGAKFVFVAMLAGLQIVNGNRPSRAIYGFLALVLIVMALSVWLARPFV